ncbi:MAG: glutaredoxin [Acholeplasma sp.]|jgi:glutaredoxin-like protein|nr:MAG: glutaredoxin [Acholeplasma sp.]
MERLLNLELQNQIKQFLSPMKEHVTLVLFTQESPCDTCTETRQLLSEIAELSDKLSFVEKDLSTDLEDADKYDITLTPSFVMLDHEGNYRGVKFNGIPAGHEINSFLTAIIDMSGVDFGFDQKTVERIKKIAKPVNIKVFVTLSCPHCPGAVSSAHRLAMLNSNIEGEMIEAQTFYELSEQYNVSGVPKIVINEQYELLGNQPIEAFLDHLEKL